MDTTTYDRPTHQTPSYGGFEVRLKPPTSIVVHSTSNPNHKNTAFAAEAKFLFVNKLAGAHYLIGKDGAVVRFFEPRKWAAWHAGNARAAYINQRSIGVELHHSVGDPPYPNTQMDALADLLSALGAQFFIPFGMMETHGKIAIAGPYQRKTDPSDWPHTDFIRWRAQLATPAPLPPSRPHRVIGLPVYQRADHTGALWGHLASGEAVGIDDLSNGHLVDDRGFVDVNGLEAL